LKLTKETVEILKSFSIINSNLVIRPGNKFSTLSSNKAIMAEYEGVDKFDETVAIFNLSEFLGVYSYFTDPEIDFDTKMLTISQNKQQVKYLYADENVLIVPKKSITMPTIDVTVNLTKDLIAQLQKMASILSVEDFAIVGDGKSVFAQVLDKKNPSANTFEIDLEVDNPQTFTIFFKIDNMRMYPADYKVEISSKKISKWSAQGLNLIVYIAAEADSTF
jgi:hypothetical protein